MTTSAPATSCPASASPVSNPVIHAIPATPPPPSTSACPSAIARNASTARRHRRIAVMAAPGPPAAAVTLALMEAGRLYVGEFAFPGPLRDQLVAAILDGTKSTTTGLLDDYERDGEPLPRPGDREVVIDSAGDPVTLIEIVAVRVLRV